VKTWYERAQLLGGENLETILIGNKCDIPATQRQVSSLDAELLAGELKTPMMETSALNGYNVEAAFVRMTKDIKASIDKRGLAG
jgi:Ras-related protein Rab-1A